MKKRFDKKYYSIVILNNYDIFYDKNEIDLNEANNIEYTKELLLRKVNIIFEFKWNYDMCKIKLLKIKISLFFISSTQWWK